MSTASRRLRGGLAIALVALAGCGLDIVETRYPTLASYDDRGWLPREVLPPSTRDILTVNNLDLSTSEGHFSFDPVDLPLFLRQVSATPPAPKGFEHSKRLADEARSNGLSVWYYANPYESLMFFCDLDAARCEYDMRTK